MPVTLITGASRGIGLAAVNHLAAAGHEMIAVSRTPPPEGTPCEFFAADLADAEATQEVLGEITSKHEIDNVVNNAGVPWPDKAGEVTMEGFDTVIAVNLRAAIIVTQACLPAMRNRKHGRIVNISSRAALGLEYRSSYSAAKAGLIGLSRTWSLELARDGITVNVVAPGPIATELFMSNNNEERIQERLETIPVGRMGKPEDVATAIAFFLGDDTGYVTGQTLFVCGGMSVA